MNLAVTIARKDGEWEVLVDPNTKASVQRRNFGDLCKELVGEYDEARVITSSTGETRRRKIRVRTPAPIPVTPPEEPVEEEPDASEVTETPESGEDLI